MKEMVLAALRRKRETAEKAGFVDQVERIDTRIAEAESAAEKQAEIGVTMSPAAQQRAADLGLAAADFKRRRPSGKTGFTVADVERIAEARPAAETTIEGETS